MVLLSKEEVINILMTATDEELGSKFLERKGIDRFREKVVHMIERDYMANPKKISDFVQTIDCRLWALKMISDFTYNALSKKRYYGNNGITPAGILYYDLNRMSVETAYNYNYIDMSEMNIAIRNLDELVSCAGYIELFRYKTKDNYLDMDDDD